MLDPEGDGGGVAVIDRHRRHVKVGLVQDLPDWGVRGDREIDGVELEPVPELRQVREGALRAEQAVDEGRGARIVARAAGAEDPEDEGFVVGEIADFTKPGRSPL